MLSDGLKRRFRELARARRFHEYEGLKRVPSIIISGGGEGWRVRMEKEAGKTKKGFNPSSSNLVLVHPWLVSRLVGCPADRPFIKNAYNTYARKIDNVSQLEREWRKVGPCLWHGRWMYGPKPCTFYRAARTLCIIRSLLQACANLVYPTIESTVTRG